MAFRGLHCDNEKTATGGGSVVAAKGTSSLSAVKTLAQSGHPYTWPVNLVGLAEVQSDFDSLVSLTQTEPSEHCPAPPATLKILSILALGVCVCLLARIALTLFRLSKHSRTTLIRATCELIVNCF